MMKKAFSFAAALVLLLSAFPGTGRAASRSGMPYSAVAYMEIEYACGCSFAGTGTMVSRYALLTAGHNLLCKDHNREARTIEFWFGYTSKSDYHYRYQGKFTYRYYCDFSNGFSSADDIGYVIFKKGVGRHTGWFGTKWYGSADEMDGLAVRTLGFKSGSLKTASGSLTVKSERQVTIPKNGSLGAEGGPVYYRDGSVYRLVAVYTSYSDSEFFCRRLTEKIISDMTADGASFS